MRQIVAISKGFAPRTLLRTVRLERLSAEWLPEIQFLTRIESRLELERLYRLKEVGLGNTAVLTRDQSIYDRSTLPSVLDLDDALEDNDVVAVTEGSRHAHVLFRQSDMHHTIFLTGRCNSLCLMCSQPPTRQNDSWLVSEAKQVAEYIKIGPQVIGFTGGEPLLLGSQLREILEHFAQRHLSTEFDVLTNARLLCDQALAQKILDGIPRRVTWMVPLYGPVDIVHDFIVQSPGAFDETVQGLLALHNYKQQIQLRIVLISPVLEVFAQLCEFIGKNLPFVREVALMVCEPIGFALANRDVCQVDLKAWWPELSDGVKWLRRSRLRILIMNAPLCVLPVELRPYAMQSISDWKRVFANECEDCDSKPSCCGLFAWHEKGWRPSNLQPLKEMDL